MVHAFNGVNIQDQLRRRRIVEVEMSSDESGGSSHGSDVDHSIMMECGGRRRDNHPQSQQPHRNLNSDDFLDWLRSMEIAFEYNTYDDEKNFKVATLRLKVPQEMTIVRFVHGLNEEIASKVELQPFWTLDDVKKLAIKVEKQNKAGKKPYTRWLLKGR
ncbi:unnamed protein product [Arabis nemorensis]|uniref:Retrotransposon gag domain-containing protein n=1 Tax=Arabis nemorensis TaxID=586526 RepID=A0A565C9B5_9BRAS|nr:unnamed protein product [Arabis nemorensis]